MRDGRARHAAELAHAESFLDTLLRLSVELPMDRGLAEVGRIFLDCVTGIVDDVAWGASIVTDSGEALVLVRLPPGAPSLRGRDPARLFPSFPIERVFPLVDGAEGSTLHVAAAATPEAFGPFQLSVVERAALVFGAALARTRAFELRTTDRAASLGQIVAGVVHELNNPLTSILAYSQYLTTKLESHEQLDGGDQERLRRIGEAAERVLEFSRDLAAYARPRHEAEAALDPRQMLEKALVFCDHEFSTHRIRVETSFPSRPLRLFGVPGQLTRVFVNLFTNAVHAMAEAGSGLLRVEAAVDEQARSFVIDITDTGCGIAEAHRAQIFEPFFTTKASGRGTGLGLAIVRDILDSHGGTIAVRSTAAAGTTFRVALPIAEG